MNHTKHFHSACGHRNRRLLAFLCVVFLLPVLSRDMARGASQASRREALEWLLEAGGTAVIREKGMHPKTVVRGQKVPQRPFEVQKIAVEKWLRPVRAEELQSLAPLDETEGLTVFHLPAGCGLGFLRDWKGLEKLSLYYADFGDDAVADLDGLSALKELVVRYNRNFTGSGLDRLAGLKNLEVLDLELTGLIDEKRPVFTAFPRLHTLSLAKNPVGEAPVEEVAELVFLRRLNLLGARLTGRALRALSRNPRLESLAMDVDSAEDIQIVAKCFPRLEELSLRSHAVDAETLSGLGEMRGLRDLILRARTVDSLPALSSLRSLSLDVDEFDLGAVESISAARALDFLSLRGKGFSEDHFRALSLPHLQTLVVYGGGIPSVPVIEPRKLKHLNTIEIREGALGLDQLRKLQAKFPEAAILQ
jgi:hypothetical protein